MPLPFSALATGDESVATQWTALQSSVTAAVSSRAGIVTATATVATKQAAYDAALAAWVAEESPPSGPEFEAKEAAFSELVLAQEALEDEVEVYTNTTAPDLMEKRKAFARAVADYARILDEAAGYGPPSDPARLFNLIYQVAFGLAPTF